MRSLIAVSLCLLVLLCACKEEKTFASLEQRIIILEAEIKDLKKLRQNTTASPRARLEEPSSPGVVLPATFVSDGSELDDPFLGPPNSDLIIMAFSDFSCRPCRRFFGSKSFVDLLESVVHKRQVKFIFRDFPLPSYTGSRTAAYAAHCAGEQGLYWEYFNLLYAESEAFSSGDFAELAATLSSMNMSRFDGCLKSQRYKAEVDKDIASAERLGVKGSPSFFIGRNASADGTMKGVLVRGAQPVAFIEREIDKLLQR